MDDINREFFEEAEKLYKKESYSEAESVLRDIISGNETFGEVYFLLSLCLLKRGRLKEAEGALQDAIMLDGENFDKARKSEDLKPIFTAIFKEEDFNSRIFRERDENGCKKHLEKAESFFGNENFEKALVSVEMALFCDPDSTHGKFLKGHILYKLERYEESVRFFEGALEVDGYTGFFMRLDKIWEGMALSLKKLKRYEEAIDACDKAIEKKKDSASAHYNRACYKCLHKEDLSCLDDLKKAIELDEKFRKIACEDSDFAAIREFPEFKEIAG